MPQSDQAERFTFRDVEQDAVDGADLAPGLAVKRFVGRTPTNICDTLRALSHGNF